FFEMPIPILAVLDGVDNIFRVEHTSDEQRFSFYIGGATVDSIGFDPDLWLLSKNNTIQEIVTGIDPFSEDPYVVFPNPATDFITVIPAAAVKKVSIVSMTGLSIDLSVDNGLIEIHHFVPGIYTLLLKDGANEVLSTKRIVINR
ncbi:MAG: T9SS type A sorting domain-containing protein, partial [Saprospiraceae bacterium]